MKASILYRIAAVVRGLGAVAPTVGVSQPPEPAWGVEAVVSAMRTHQFDVQGSSRTYWDLFMAAGLSVGVLYLFAGVLAWQLGGLPGETLTRMRGVAWTFALCFAALTAVSFRYLFILPVILCAVVALLLISAAWLASR